MIPAQILIERGTRDIEVALCAMNFTFGDNRSCPGDLVLEISGYPIVKVYSVSLN